MTVELFVEDGDLSYTQLDNKLALTISGCEKFTDVVFSLKFIYPNLASKVLDVVPYFSDVPEHLTLPKTNG